MLNSEGALFTHYTIKDRAVPEAFDGFKIAFISDFHYKSTLREAGLAVIIKQLNESGADIIILGGDYAEGRQRANLTERREANLRELFSYLVKLQAPYGVYAVLGNHDDYHLRNRVIAEINRAGITNLENNGLALSRGSQRLWLAGVADMRFSLPNLPAALAGRRPDDFTILVSHTPDFVEQYDVSAINLVLSGHTHGGQVTFLGWAPFTSSRYRQRYKYGLVPLPSGNGQIIITSGIGTSLLNVRLGPPEEIVIITLRAN
ncbi:MAG: metallophosphoesterase [Spirochaetaceae bacterium]|nr:metallophosphoesterase [Spirochaetaceae bacterium]